MQALSRSHNKLLQAIFWCLVLIPLLSRSFTLDAQISPHVITFFVRPLPDIVTEGQEKALERQTKLKEPKESTLTGSLIKNEGSPDVLNRGVYVSYAGNLSRSDRDGQVMFERKTAGSKVHVIITQDIVAVPVDPLKEKTIYGFVLSPKALAQHYLFEKLQDPTSMLYFWRVTSLPAPKNKRLPYDTVIIFAHPKHVVVPLEDTITLSGENLVLPDFFTTKHLASATNALRFLKIRQYFAPVKFEYSFAPESYQKMIKRS